MDSKQLRSWYTRHISLINFEETSMQVSNTSQTTSKPDVNFTAPPVSPENREGVRARLTTSHISWHEPTFSGPPLPSPDSGGKPDDLFEHFADIKRADKVTTIAPPPTSRVSKEIICDANNSTFAESLSSTHSGPINLDDNNSASVPIDFSKDGLPSTNDQSPRPPDLNNPRNALRLPIPRPAIPNSTTNAKPVMGSNPMMTLGYCPISNSQILLGTVMALQAAVDLAQSKADVTELINNNRPLTTDNPNTPKSQVKDLVTDSDAFFDEPSGPLESLSERSDRIQYYSVTPFETGIGWNSTPPSTEDEAEDLKEPGSPDATVGNSPELKADMRQEVVPASLANAQKNLASAIASVSTKLGDER